MKKHLTLITILLLTIWMCYSAQAQLGKIIGGAAKRTIERKAEEKTTKAVGSAIDKATDPDSYKEKDNDQQKSQNNSSNSSDETDGETSTSTPRKTEKKSPEMAYNKFDFVAGDEIIFEDNMVGEKVGEFPSKWDLIKGEAEIAKMNGETVIVLKQGCYIRPLMKDIYNYFGDVYTIEFDYWFTMEKGGEDHGNYWIGLIPSKEKYYGHNKFTLSIPGYVTEWHLKHSDGKVSYSYDWTTTSDERTSGRREEMIEHGNWVHISMSFNKRAMKIYVNENRIANIPNMTNDIGWLAFWYGSSNDSQHGYIRNFRIAKGAVPLYDRMLTDGKIVSYGITFDVGKSTIKPESMGEINRIAEFMKENSDIKFSVEGHTDNTGNAENNLKLSEERSQAVMNKLIELGISKDRLKSAGKGQTTPISDNTTDEGRAKNRRVEFVKI